MLSIWLRASPDIQVLWDGVVLDCDGIFSLRAQQRASKNENPVGRPRGEVCEKRSATAPRLGI